jgi:hypothetical protein
MNRLPDWTPEEFEILLQHNSVPAEDLSIQLVRRSADAVQIVRNGIHEFHKKGESSLLSIMMKERLSKSGMGLACPLCGERIIISAG